VDAFVHSIRLALIALEAHHTKLRLDCARADGCDSNVRPNQVVPHRGGDGINRVLGCAVHSAAAVRLMPRYAANEDDVAVVALHHAGREGAQ
jgi:hypothetical protein